MITVGVDLAAESERTAIAILRWSGQSAQLTDLSLGASDDRVIAAVRSADKAGVDCPFGWPVRFVELVTAHRDDRVVAPASSGRPWRRGLVLRETDLFVQEHTGLTPLSVSADRIGHVALRWSAVMARLQADGVDCRRDGLGRVSEVYPAGALKVWGLLHRGYKRAKNGVALGALVDALVSGYPWLDLGAAVDLCRASDDAFDAVVSALVARAVALGLTHPAPTPSEATTEGWIHLPSTQLGDLVTPEE